MSTFPVDRFPSSVDSKKANPQTSKAEAVIRSLQQNAKKSGSDRLDVSLEQLYKSLTVLATEVLEKLQEVLGDSLPDGIYALKPEDHTPEKTSQRIVDGVTGLFGVFARQNKNLEGEELLNAFMKTIRGGISQGYKQAESILGDIGAFRFDGVKSGIDETKRLVEEKLQAFETNYRDSLRKTETEAVPKES